MFAKASLGLLFLFGHVLSQFYHYNEHFPSSIKGSGSLLGNYDNLFIGQDTSSLLNAGLSSSGLDVSNQISLGSPFQQAFAPVDPATLTCGTALPCQQSKYRTYDGSCNNPTNSILGTPQTTFSRLLPPRYADGVGAPTVSISGRPLPLARTLSLVFFPDVPIDDPKFTLAAMQYGQIITHDMSMIAGSTQSTPHSTQCCTPDGQLLQGPQPQNCFPLVLPPKDPQTLQGNIRCMNFVRTTTDRDRNCVPANQPGEQLTVVNHYLDLSVVYGNTIQVNQQVREFQGGRLRVDIRHGKPWLPQNPNVTGVCPGVQSPDEPCYLAGDMRVNQNPQLTVLQILLLREHNRLANILAKLNPNWNDETIFQEARRINMAQHQHITYYEWLPIFLGVSNTLNNKIIYDTKGFVNDYNPSVNPSVINEHATAAFRYFHVLIAGFLDLVNPHRSSSGTIRMSDWFNRPAILEQNNNLDDLTRGLATQPEKKANQFADSEITQFLFRLPGQTFGQDLRAIDIQRNRDHGLASYNDFRAFCGLSKAQKFEDFLDVISPEVSLDLW